MSMANYIYKKTLKQLKNATTGQKYIYVTHSGYGNWGSMGGKGV